jgi:signal recognition particle GTPase
MAGINLSGNHSYFDVGLQGSGKTTFRKLANIFKKK